MAEAENYEEEGFIRPFLMTSGRTHSKVKDLSFETLVQRLPEATNTNLRFEMAQIFELVEEPLSIAEISAHLSIPLGVAKVAAGDLIERGLLEAYKSVANDSDEDIDLIHRLMAGVRRL